MGYWYSKLKIFRFENSSLISSHRLEHFIVLRLIRLLNKRRRKRRDFKPCIYELLVLKVENSSIRKIAF